MRSPTKGDKFHATHICSADHTIFPVQSVSPSTSSWSCQRTNSLKQKCKFASSVCACLDLSVSSSSSSWGLGRAVVCDCGTPWTFLLPFLQIVNLEQVFIGNSAVESNKTLYALPDTQHCLILNQKPLE